MTLGQLKKALDALREVDNNEEISFVSLEIDNKDVATLTYMDIEYVGLDPQGRVVISNGYEEDFEAVSEEDSFDDEEDDSITDYLIDDKDE